ncbi:hypothetical protein IFM89_028210, partial [Coptis chinensis]
MESVHRFSQRLFPISSLPDKCFKTCKSSTILKYSIFLGSHSCHVLQQPTGPLSNGRFISNNRTYRSTSTTRRAGGWFLGLGGKKKEAMLPDIVKAGDPVLHEAAQEVPVEEIGSDKIQKIIDDMIMVLRKAPGVGLAAPQIGIPLKIIVLEDTKEYISYAPKEENEARDRRPFELLVILNPKLKKKNDKTALFFEGCL